MNIVQVTPQPVETAAMGGSIRMHGLLESRIGEDTIRRFAQYHWPFPEGSEYLVVGPDYVEYKHRSLVHSALGFVGGKWNLPLLLHVAVPWFSSGPQLEQWARTADVVFLERPWQLAAVAPLIDDTPLVYSSHNYEPEMIDASLSAVDRWVQRIERRAITRADLVVTTSKRDERLYREAFDIDTPIHVAPSAATPRPNWPSGTDTELDIDTTSETTLALFVGSKHLPNVKAVEHIVEFASDRRLAGNVHFLVAGNVCESFDAEKLPSNITLLGFVDSLDPYYATCDVGLNPITTGGGTNMKMLEYFAHGLCVLTTPFGARGIEADPERHYLSEPVENFPAVLSSLDTDEAESIGAEARTLVETKLNWSRVSSNLFERVEEITTRS